MRMSGPGPAGGQVDLVGAGAADKRLDPEEALVAGCVDVHLDDRAGLAEVHFTELGAGRIESQHAMLRVPQVDREETGASPVNLRQGISSFGDQVGPGTAVAGLGAGQVDADHFAARSIEVSLQIENVAGHARRLRTGPAVR